MWDCSCSAAASRDLTASCSSPDFVPLTHEHANTHTSVIVTVQSPFLCLYTITQHQFSMFQKSCLFTWLFYYSSLLSYKLHGHTVHIPSSKFISSCYCNNAVDLIWRWHSLQFSTNDDDDNSIANKKLSSQKNWVFCTMSLLTCTTCITCHFSFIKPSRNPS